MDVGTIYKYIPVLSGEEYVTYINQKSSGPHYDDVSALKFTDWQRYLTRNSFSQQYRLSASGRTNKSNYFIAGGYLQNAGIVRTTGLNQLDLRANVSYDLTSKLKLTARYNTLRRINDMTTGTDNTGA